MGDAAGAWWSMSLAAACSAGELAVLLIKVAVVLAIGYLVLVGIRALLR